MTRGFRSDVLAAAVGRVAIEATETDDLMRSIVDSYFDKDAIELLTEGQGAKWLIEKCEKIILVHNEVNDIFPADEVEDYRAALREIGRCDKYRDFAVHSRWELTDNNTRQSALNDTGRPWGNKADGGPLLMAIISKRQGEMFRLFTPGDIAELADRFVAAGSALAKAWDTLTYERFGRSERGYRTMAEIYHC